jgi:Uma2 family endonuclease
MEAGVREYWIVSPKSKIVQSFSLENGAYVGKVYDSGAVLPSTTCEGLSISLSEVFAG